MSKLDWLFVYRVCILVAVCVGSLLSLSGFERAMSALVLMFTGLFALINWRVEAWKRESHQAASDD